MWAQREYIVLPTHTCNFDSASSHHHNKGGLEKVLYPEGSQRALQKLHKLQTKKQTNKKKAFFHIHVENLIRNILLSRTTPPDVNERLPTHQENGILESKPTMGPGRGEFFPKYK